jgi:two-component system, chemotaxis family, sensor kinase Cph1
VARTATIAADDLDRLNAEELDALPHGLIQVDGQGTVHLYNMAECRLSGRTADRILGRNFFREIAPCSDVPAFGGRFRDGVAAGSLDVAFDFVFGFRMAPVRVAVHMMRAAEPDRYWITVQKIADVVPDRPALGTSIGDDVSMAAVDHTVCDREPIHMAGAIQPWGALVAVDPKSGMVVSASENAYAVLERDTVLGQPLASVVDPTTAAAILAWGARTPTGDADTWFGETPPSPVLDVLAHRSGAVLIVEVEPVSGRNVRAAAALARQLAHGTVSMRNARTLAELGELAVVELRAMTGFERVLLYRFDAEGHGEVIAEDKVDDWDQSFAGLHFPAGDIPRQARALYRRSTLRLIADGDYVAVPIRSVSGAAPLDLSLARSRSLSPVHREYHRNMGVNGAMSLSILAPDGLWGLLIFHHRAPHFVDVATRAAAVAMVETLASQVRTVGLVEAERDHRRDQAILSGLMVGLAGHDDLLRALVDGRPNIKDLFAATGVAVRVDGRTAMIGATPTLSFILKVVEWLGGRWNAGGCFVTENLGALMPAAAAHRDTASGILALDLGDGGWVVWMRAEEPRTVDWAGTPAKTTGDDGMPMPRASFERWVEERRGYAAPWDPWAPEVAIAVRHAVRDVLLRHLREVRTLSAQLAESNRVKAQFMANMSHELRTPLNAIIGFSELIRSGVVGKVAAPVDGYVDDIHAAGEHLLAMVNDVLDMSRIDAGRLEVNTEALPAGAAVEEAVALMRPRARQRGVEVRAFVGDGIMVLADRVRLRQILLNLLSNAVKFTPAGGRVDVMTATSGMAVDFRVVDSGPGMTETEIAMAMEPFRHDVSMTRPDEAGTGLGLPIVRSLTGLLGGRLRLTSTPGVGTVAIVSLPLAATPTGVAHQERRERRA